MKATTQILASFGFALALVTAAFAQDAAAPKPEEKKKPATAPKVTVAKKAAPKKDELRLNFRGVPLDMVLNYLSEAAGFTIVLETSVKGTVDVWSNQPLTKAEAVQLLNSVLNKNGYAAIQSDRTLTIVTRDEAKKRDVPVKSGNNPELIPKNDEIVTQIIPVRYINAAQVTRDLASLLPASATIAANEAGNSIVMTDTQTNIRRVTEIVSALDTAVSGVATIKIYPLQYADAKALAATIKDLFSPDTGRGSRGGSSAIASFIASRMGGGGGPPGGPGGDSGRSRGGSGGGAGAANAHVVAVSDDYSNSLIVSAPDDMMASIDELVKQVDAPIQDVTEIKVFKLKYADPVEMAEVLSTLFPDESKSSQNNSSRFGGFFGGMTPPGVPGGDRNRGGGSGDDKGSRAKKQGRVLSVADPRTASVIVTASHDLMPQIESMIQQLDNDPAKKQKVFVYSLENADTQEVEQILKNLFESQNSARNTRNTGQSQNSALTTRSSPQSQSQNSSSRNNNSGLGGGASSGLGGGTGLGGR